MPPTPVFLSGILAAIGLVLQMVQFRRSKRVVPLSLEKWYIEYRNHGNWWPPQRWPERLGLLLSSKLVSDSLAHKEWTLLFFHVKHRAFPPFALGGLLFLGTVVYGPLLIAAGQVTVVQFMTMVCKVAVFWAVLTVKGFLSAIVAAAVLVYGVFHFMQTGELLLVPMFNELLGWVFNTSSGGLFTIYSLGWVIFGSYESVTAILES
jgi:hypothetical protein